MCSGCSSSGGHHYFQLLNVKSISDYNKMFLKQYGMPISMGELVVARATVLTVAQGMNFPLKLWPTSSNQAAQGQEARNGGSNFNFEIG